MNSIDSPTDRSECRKVLICRNPKSGAFDRQAMIEKLAEALSVRGFEVESTASVAELCDLAEKYSNSGQLRTVVAAGGDGTASMLANELPPAAAITVFPLGTANLLAKYLGANADVEITANTISAGQSVLLDAGEANNRLFLVVASCGFDADVVDRIHASRTGHINYFSYALPILRSIWKYRFPKMELLADGQQLDPARWAFIFNLPHYAMDLKLIDDANGQDGLLDLCTFRDGGFLTGLGYFFAVVLRRHRKIRTTRFRRFRRLVIQAKGRVPYELDGDPGGYLPVAIRVLPERVRFLVSDDWIARRGS